MPRASKLLATALCGHIIYFTLSSESDRFERRTFATKIKRKSTQKTFHNRFLSKLRVSHLNTQLTHTQTHTGAYRFRLYLYVSVQIDIDGTTFPQWQPSIGVANRSSLSEDEQLYIVLHNSAEPGVRHDTAVGSRVVWRTHRTTLLVFCCSRVNGCRRYRG